MEARIQNGKRYTHLISSLIRTLCGKDVKKIGFFGYGKSNAKLHELLKRKESKYVYTYRSTTAANPPDGIEISER